MRERRGGGGGEGAGREGDCPTICEQVSGMGYGGGGWG